MIPRHPGARGGKLRTHRDGPQGGQERVALSGAQNELDFLAAGLTYRGLHASDAAE